MKTKLLRKVRKRYQIFRYPNGIDWSWTKTDVLTLVLVKDLEMLTYNQMVKSCGIDGFYVDGIIVPEEKAIKQLKERMLLDILKEYRNKGVRRIKQKQKRNLVYYNENINNI